MRRNDVQNDPHGRPSERMDGSGNNEKQWAVIIICSTLKLPEPLAANFG
jgi:hypothetical protein